MRLRSGRNRINHRFACGTVVPPAKIRWIWRSDMVNHYSRPMSHTLLNHTKNWSNTIGHNGPQPGIAPKPHWWAQDPLVSCCVPPRKNPKTCTRLSFKPVTQPPVSGIPTKTFYNVLQP